MLLLTYDAGDLGEQSRIELSLDDVIAGLFGESQLRIRFGVWCAVVK